MGKRKNQKIGKMILLLFMLILIFSPSYQAEKKSPKKFQMTIDNIMREEELVGTSPSGIRWSSDGERIYFEWKKSGEEKSATYFTTKDGAEPQKLAEEEIKNIPPTSAEWDKAKKLALFVEGGDIFIFDSSDNKKYQITRTSDMEWEAHFTADGKKITFAKDNNLYVLSLEKGELIQATDFKTTKPEAPPKLTETQKFLIEQQKKLFEQFKKEREEREAQFGRAMRQRMETAFRDKRQPFFLEKNQSVRNLKLSPDEKYVIFTIFERSDDSKPTIVPDYVTRDGYTRDIQSRSKAGDVFGIAKTGIYYVDDGKVVWIDHGQGERKVSILNYTWSSDGKNCAMIAFSDDHKDRWILLLSPSDGKTTVLDHFHDDAWIDGPGVNTFGWMPDDKHVYFISEKDGYAHLYTLSLDGKDLNQLTQGKFEIYSPQISNDKTKWYFTSNEVHPGERHFYSMPIEGGKRTKITSMVGNNMCYLSPDESMIAILYSYSNQPPEIYLKKNEPSAKVKRITTSTTEEFRSYNWIAPEIVTFKSDDGVTIYARLYKPKKPAKGNPAVLFVHGAGYLQNVHKWWSSYFREYMFHHFLMEHGYIVLDIDYRASSGYGRYWRTAIYRHMGGKDLDDLVSGAKYLVKEHKVDPKRIGIYGGSYGGFLTLMAMFTKPDVFAAGAALRPVTDWAHYSYSYTSNILNIPQEDKEAYEKSSPVYFAEGLKNPLLICHGMVDVNVHFQDTVRLVQRLIELRKENWEVAIYPVEDHGFKNPTSWADEYKRIFKLFGRYLKK
ncbi:MAG: prolyl oligopeptidase family serine peptidase [Acidobacteriota bacterium]